MKKNIIYFNLVLSMIVFLSVSCRKDYYNPGNKWFQGNDPSTHAKNFSSEVPQKWIEMQLRILRVPGGVSVSASRCQAYCGIALYESVVPGMPSYRSLAGQLNELPSLPQTDSRISYHWPTSANAALATINRTLLSATNDANKASMDSLESALNAAFQSEIDDATFQRSVEFGKNVGQAIADWSKTDGTFGTYPPYTPPGSLPNAAPGLWVPTPPNYPAPVNPNQGKFRVLVTGSNSDAEPTPPPAYSEEVNSPYYAMVKEVYDISKTLTPEQTALALYFRDAPGYPGAGHFISIFDQVLIKTGASLDKAALAYAESGIAMQDAIIACFNTKYTKNLERPIQYIWRVFGQTSWFPLFNTPGHPEFPSAHSNQGGAFAAAMEDVFGKNFQFTDHTYDYLNMAPQSFESFEDMAVKIGESRVYGGIHYRASCEKGRKQGEKIAQNILQKLSFK